MMKNFFKKQSFRFYLGVLKIVLFSLVFYQNCSARIVNEKGKVLRPVVDIFRHFKPLIEEKKDTIVEKRGLSTEKIDSILNVKTPVSNISLKDLNDIAQVVFLRPSNKERKDLEQFNKIFLPYINQKILNLFRSIGDVGPIYPKHKKYRYIFFNGSTVKNMRQRLKILADLISAQKLLITPKTKIVVLTGERDLFPEEDVAVLMDPSPLQLDTSWKKPPLFPITEDQAAQWIWNQSLLPSSLRSAKITFVRAQKKVEIDPQTKQTIVKRPTTFDTIQTWVQEEKLEPGPCLSISNQPYVYYQKATIENVFKKSGLLDKGFSVEGVGSSLSGQKLNDFKENIAIVLDNFARTIYTEVNR